METNLESAKNSILHVLINRIASKNGLEKAIKCVADYNDLSYEDLKEWANATQDKLTKSTKSLQTAIFKSTEKKEQKEQKEQKGQKEQKEQGQEQTEPAKIVVIKRSQNMDDKVMPTSDERNFNIVMDTTNNIYRRIDSISMVKDRDLLVKLYNDSEAFEIKREIIKVCNLEEIHALALKESSELLRVEAIKAVHNRMIIRQEAVNNSSIQVRIEAVRKTQDPHILQKIIINEPDFNVRKTALNQIKSPSLLEAMKHQISEKFLPFIDERINVLRGNDDHLKKSIQHLIDLH